MLDAKELQGLAMDDPGGQWLSLDSEEGGGEGEGMGVVPAMAELRHVQWDVALPMPALGVGAPALRSLSLGPNADVPDLDGVTHLRTTNARVLDADTGMPHGLVLLHLTPALGADVPRLVQLLPDMTALRDLRLSVAHDVVLDGFLTALPTSLRILALREIPPPPSSLSSLSSPSSPPAPKPPNLRALFTAPLLTPTTSHLARLPHLRVLSLSFSSSPSKPKTPKHSTNESLCASRHEHHLPTARTLLGALPSLREVHFSGSGGGGCGSASASVSGAEERLTECVWGRAAWDYGPSRGNGMEDEKLEGQGGKESEVEGVWMDVGARTRLWESAAPGW